jgi:hypothetical protein
MCQLTQQFCNKQMNTTVIRVVCVFFSTSASLYHVGSSSANRYLSMLLFVGLFTDMEPDQGFYNFNLVCIKISIVKFKL